MKHFLIFFVLLAMGSRLSAHQNGLPSKRPADFTLTFRFDGGMSYHFEEIKITSDSCTYEQNLKGHIILRRFKLSEADLNNLYAMLQQNQFTQIVFSTAGHVHDRGGISIAIGWDNNRQRYTVIDSGSSFVASEWKYRWMQICDYVKKLP